MVATAVAVTLMCSCGHWFILVYVCFAAGAWRPVEAPEELKERMRSIWRTSLKDAEGGFTETLSAPKTNRNKPVKVTTGLGLPLCRGFAQAAGGWLALDDSDSVYTNFWCCIPATVPPRRVLAAPPPRWVA